MKDVDKAHFLDAPISQAGLFGDTVEGFAQQFSAVQQQTEAIQHTCPGVMHHPPLPPGPGLSLPVTVGALLRPPELLRPRPNRYLGRCVEPLAGERHPPHPSQAPSRPGSRRSGPDMDDPVMLEFTLSQETQRTAPLLPLVEGREENLPFLSRRPPKFNGVLETSVAVRNAPVLHEEIAVLLAKDAIEPVPPAERRQGFYSPYFIVPKKRGGLRPILDLRVLNRALHKLPFKMRTRRRISKCIHPQDWFAAIDLKDAYFHVSILLRHRPFLRFAFKGRAWQYRVLPFGLSLSPCVFTKVVEGALTPLREVGVKILNYLDNWLILAQSREQLGDPRDLVLRHLSQLGLWVNWEKSCDCFGTSTA